MATAKKNLRTLVLARARRKGHPVESIGSVAEACGISRQHLYNLMNGDQAASDWVVDGLVEGLGVSRRAVTDALKASGGGLLE